MIRRLLLIGALPPPTGGDAVWAENFLRHPLNQDLQIQTVNTSLIGRRAQSLGNRFNAWEEIRRTYRIWRSIVLALWRFQPDVVHLNCNCSAMGVIRDFASLGLARLWRVPVVLHCHANAPDAIGGSRLGALFFRWCLKAATRVLVLNQASAGYCKQLGGVACEILPNFINDDEIAASRLTRETVANVVFVGHLIRTKGVFEIREVARRFPGLVFVMAGILTPEMAGQDIPGNMQLLGNIEKRRLQEILDNADLLLFPTYTEGFSMALLEAMARGLPVVTTAVGANADMIENKGGLLVPVGSVEGLCGALQQMQDPATRDRMSRWNISKVRNNYSAHQVISRLRALYAAVQKPVTSKNSL